MVSSVLEGHPCLRMGPQVLVQYCPGYGQLGEPGCHFLQLQTRCCSRLQLLVAVAPEPTCQQTSWQEFVTCKHTTERAQVSTACPSCLTSCRHTILSLLLLQHSCTAMNATAHTIGLQKRVGLRPLCAGLSKKQPPHCTPPGMTHGLEGVTLSVDALMASQVCILRFNSR